MALRGVLRDANVTQVQTQAKSVKSEVPQEWLRMATKCRIPRSQEALKQLWFSPRNCDAGLATRGINGVFAQQSCEILRVCHVQRASKKKLLRISDVSWWGTAKLTVESDCLTV